MSNSKHTAPCLMLYLGSQARHSSLVAVTVPYLADLSSRAISVTYLVLQRQACLTWTGGWVRGAILQNVNRPVCDN